MSTASLGSSFLTPSNLSPLDITANKIILALLFPAWFCVLLRLYIRWKYAKFGLDDYLMVAAVCAYTATTGCMIQLVYLILSGRALTKFQSLSDFYCVGSILVFLTVLLVKLALGVFFLRLLIQKWSRAVVYMTMILSTVVCLTAVLVSFITCGSPRHAVYFTFTGICKGRPHISRIAFSWFIIFLPSYVNLAVDVVLSILPIPMLLQTTLDRRQKITVSLFLGFSTIGCVSSVLKVINVEKRNFTSTSIGDLSKTLTLFIVYTSLEIFAYIVGGCLATYRPLLNIWARKIGRHYGTARSHYRTDSSNLHSTIGSPKSRSTCNTDKPGPDSPGRWRANSLQTDEPKPPQEGNDEEFDRFINANQHTRRLTLERLDQNEDDMV
ncbi:hypothetical protein BT63DRAFT_419945 [Microthyrium microscopicum]|uniref:Rhodopsin domain-containing protein n=1 Tax=Microthyrium microscopicum TaxID=703497 RepID=A0A6A6UTB1_9PEZI|nr:hypothetical protein BT63DRAFT_419945 [Microthyrium microscopicum]